MRLPRRALVASFGFAGLLGAAALSFGPIVRSRIASEAARRNLDVEVGAVRLAWFAIQLNRVELRPRGVPGLRVRLDGVNVELGATLDVRETVVTGGNVDFEGDPDVLAEQVRAWRGERSSGPSSSGGARVPVRAEGITLTWKVLPNQQVPDFAARGVAFSKDASGYKVALEGASLHHHDVALDAATVSVDFDGAANLRSAKAATVQVAYELRTSTEDEAAPAVLIPHVDLVPPPLPATTPMRRSGRAAPTPVAGVVALPSAPVLPLPDVHAIRAKIGRVAALVGARVPEGSSLSINGLSLQLAVRGDRISLGPGPLSIERRAENVHLTFATSGDTAPRAGATMLSIDGVLPLAEGDVVLSLAGGPVRLPLLGVKGGLADVDRATVAGRGRVVIAAAGESLTFDGDVQVRDLAVRHPKLASDVMRGLDFGVSARGLLADNGQLRVDDAALSMGALKIHGHGGLQQSPDHVTASISFDVPASSCQSLLDSAPSALVPTIRGARMGGTLGGRGRLAFDTARIDDLALEYDIEDRCHMVEVPNELSRDRFSRSFSHRIYLPDGKLADETTGPGTSNWTDLELISPYMQVAVLTTEDGAFMRHHGFNHAAIRSSLVANIKARKFVRGASTITMQLAKNLFLLREKTLSRKLEEVILTDYLEQIFRKDDMMELYLNIIEFGPNVYGVTRAAEHYFGRKPAELNLAECLFLSSIMPAPVRYHRIYEKGEVSEAWLKHIHQLMEIARKTGKISSKELEEGLAEAIVFQRPDMPPPTPRLPVGGTHLLGDDDDSADWQPL